MAKSQGFEHFLAPVRPTGKTNYPMHTLTEYASWLRDDGQPLDPWLRTHQKMGAKVLLLMEHCHMFSGSIAEWASSTNLEIRSSGLYIVPGALSPLCVDIESDLGTMVEGNVWMSHPLG